jgi:hypothetical protein
MADIADMADSAAAAATAAATRFGEDWETEGGDGR